MTPAEAVEAARAGQPFDGADLFSDDELLLDYDQAAGLLPRGETIRTMTPGPPFLFAEWDRAGVLDLLARSPRLELAGPFAMGQGHGLCAWRPGGGPLFIQIRPGDEP